MAKRKKVAVKKTPAKRPGRNLIGSWSFLVGIILAVILGLGLGGTYQSTMIWIVFVLGLLVGILNIAADEVHGFLWGGTVLVLVSYFGVQVGVFSSASLTPIANILKGIMTLFVPATIIVALRSVFVLAKK